MRNPLLRVTKRQKARAVFDYFMPIIDKLARLFDRLGLINHLIHTLYDFVPGELLSARDDVISYRCIPNDFS